MPTYNLRKRSVSNEDVSGVKAISDLAADVPEAIIGALGAIGVKSAAEIAKASGNKLFDKWAALGLDSKNNHLDSVFVHAWFKFLEYRAKNVQGPKEIKDFLMGTALKEQGKRKIAENKPQSVGKKEERALSPAQNKSGPPSRPGSPGKSLQKHRKSPINATELEKGKEQLRKAPVPLKRKVDPTELHSAKKQLIHIPSCESLSTIVSPQALISEKKQLKHVTPKIALPSKGVSQKNAHVHVEPVPGVQGNTARAVAH